MAPPVTLRRVAAIYLAQNGQSGPSKQVPDEGDQEENQENVEKNFGDPGSRERNAGKTKNSCDQRDDKKR
jgi:hypothetical protein